MMKTTFLVLLTAITFSVSAQFPTPQDFQFSYEYFTCNESGFCKGIMVNGPAYCSDFWWNAPDTASTTAHLEHFKVYYLDYFSWDTSVIATTQELQVEMLIGIIGKIWVTAVYSDPEGESPPSNTVENIDLPIGITENQQNINELCYYDPVNQAVHFADWDQVREVKIIDIQGKTMKIISHPTGDVSLQDLMTGCYFIIVTTDDSNLFRKKILK